MTASAPDTQSPQTELVWTRLAHARVRELTGDASRAPRALVVGTAGSGKSLVLQHLRSTLRSQGTHVALASSSPDLSTLPRDAVLFVDDAHLMTESQLLALQSRLEDDEAGVVLACRPWPRSEQLRLIARRLEQGRPPIVLGHLGAAELRSHLAREGTTVPETCLSALLELCGAVTWLVREALLAHGTGPCNDPEHRAVQTALTEIVAARLHTIEPAVAARVQNECLNVAGTADADADADETAMAGYAEGLLLRNGRPVPIVRTAVLATIPVDRLIALLSGGASRPSNEVMELLTGVTDPRIATALVELGDTMLERDPARAAELYRNAASSGADPTAIAVRLARAAWTRGDLDRACALIDSAEVPPGHPLHDEAVDIAGSVWAARGFMSISTDAYASGDISDPQVAAHAAIAALGSGDGDALESALGVAAPLRTYPSTLSVSMRLLGRGLRAGVTPTAAGALDEMVRAAERYTESGAHGPIPELPAVLAALTAVNTGELDVAHGILTAAHRGGHGGAWAKPRLLLWTAWVALRRQHPDETLLRLENVRAIPGELSARDRLLRDAVVIGHTRRYGDPATLPTVWHRVRDDVMHVQPDLFSLFPLTEFVTTAALLGDAERFESAFTEALDLIDRLGHPPAWSAHLHWAGFQKGVLLGRPDELTRHARALVTAAQTSPVAAAMSRAGKVWTEALTGTVDVDAIEHAAAELAKVGLAWDGARLASHGAGRSEERRTVARLLSTARQLHPNRETPDAEHPQPARAGRGPSMLSPREMEVAALVISGKTYAEIGETIFISPRTAEHHIARIRRRLGATSRSDLIARLRAIVEDPDGAGPDEHGGSAWRTP